MKFLIFSKFQIIQISLVIIFVSSLEMRLQLPEFYHTSENIDREIKSMLQSCHQHVQISEHSIKNFYKKEVLNIEYLNFYDITSTGSYSENTPKKNVYLLFGEHPREMISTELGLHYLKQLCQGGQEYKHLLEKFNFRIVVNANPNGRKDVEKGEYCKRTNLNNVDLNRNWNYHWNKDIGLPEEENPGSRPFSENETVFIHDSLKKFDAHIFLSIHSGFYGLFLPYAYNRRECRKNNRKMKSILNEMQERYCSVCKVGSPALLIGYKSSGTCLDYAYKRLKVPYTFAFEIYSDEMPFPEIDSKINRVESFLEKKLKTVKNLSAIKKELMRSTKTKFTHQENEICLSLFNPLDKARYDLILSNWTNVDSLLNLGFQLHVGKISFIRSKI